jgi:FKBP-type peptidyl-prolyl cis-trans isomerase FkpA
MKALIKSVFAVSLVVAFAGCDNKTAPDAGPAVVAAKPFEPPKPPPPPPPLTGEDKTMATYGLGVMLAQRTPVQQAGLTEAELKEVMRGFNDALDHKDLEVKVEDFGPKVDQFLTERHEIQMAATKKKNEEYLAKVAKEKGMKKEASGLLWMTVSEGKGENPKPTDSVSVHYKGTLIDGTEFDSSYKRNAPADFPLMGVIKCWTEGVQKMKPGGKARLVCPPEIAYGPGGRPGIPGNSVLNFDVELIAVKPPPPAPPGGAPGGMPPGMMPPGHPGMGSTPPPPMPPQNRPHP